MNIDLLGKGVEKRVKSILAGARKSAGKRIRAAAEDAKTPRSARKRRALYDSIAAIFSRAGARINKQIVSDLTPVAEDATENAERDATRRTRAGAASAKGGGLVQFSEARMNRILEAANPATAENMVATMTTAMRNSTVAALRTAFVDVMRRGAVENLTANDIQREMQVQWTRLSRDASKMKFRDKSGRAWEDGRYLQMLIRTTAWGVWREAYYQRGAELGVDLYKISEDGGAGMCHVCAEWEGRIVSLTGKDTRFPSMEEAKRAGVFHPNCVHRPIMMVAGWDDEEISQQARGNKRGGGDDAEGD